MTPCSTSVSAQTRLGDLPPKHRRAVENFLAEKKHLAFVPESRFGVGYTLAELRKELKLPSFKPYYARGDFNGDRLEDFAVILEDTRRQKPPEGMEPESVLGHAVVVFDGTRRGSFRVAYEETKLVLRQAFLQYVGGRLHFLVWETDHCEEFNARRGRYTIKWVCDPDA